MEIQPIGTLAQDTRGDDKHANTHLRWNLLWLVFTVGVVPLGLWLGFISPWAQMIVMLSLGGLGLMIMTVCSINVVRAVVSMRRDCKMDWKEKFDDERKGQLVLEEIETGKQIRMEDILHIAFMVAYNEPIAVIRQSLDSIACQTQAKQIIVVVAFEKSTKDLDKKIQDLKEGYKSSFHSLMFTAHPRNWSGVREIPGKCSNANYAMRSITSYLESKGMYDEERLTITSLDTDTIFPPRYFENLAYQFLTRDDKFHVFWQGMLAYNFHLADRPFFCRCISLFRSAFMIGLLIPFNINPMSVFSLSLKLAREARFSHPFYQMDDLTLFTSATSAAKCRIQITPINMPVVCGPTSGASYFEEIKEWYKQGKRWTIGAAEVLHYICIKGRTLPRTAYIRFLMVFMIYYGFVLCSMTLTGLLSFVGTLYQPSVGPDSAIYIYIGLGMYAVNYVLYLVILWMDKAIVRMLEEMEMVEQHRERVGYIQGFMHWLMMFPSLAMYSVVEYIALWEITIYGKKVCGHKAAAKDGIAPKETKENMLSLEKEVST
eukprot:CAMPEP_0203761288 /NCGR_PEP_ID=MMETSP0098-20131031/14404_1 /ASSEMBLY_ACC=CAM_ASM_000208 /TAXON_ID=96639 /ORGANISM=" , Strain NY0313808BC1" /LENGTH=543 /DNA_ID=CAMNT_0050655209 /DNA_START=1165 /DNA_END=2793 /DNA_ORIENTATION=+